MKTPFGKDTAEIEYTEEQIKNIEKFFEDVKKHVKLSGQLPTLNKPIHSNGNKRNKSTKQRQTVR